VAVAVGWIMAVLIFSKVYIMIDWRIPASQHCQNGSGSGSVAVTIWQWLGDSMAVWQWLGGSGSESVDALW
jgi:hypothetical protein